jgi:hypothetical protein
LSSVDSKKDKIWAEAKKRYRLSNEVIQMAKKLGLNPKKFGGLANHKQEPWKQPLSEFIKSIYEKRYGSSTLESLNIE